VNGVLNKESIMVGTYCGFEYDTGLIDLVKTHDHYMSPCAVMQCGRINCIDCLARPRNREVFEEWYCKFVLNKTVESESVSIPKEWVDEQF